MARAVAAAVGARMEFSLSLRRRRELSGLRRPVSLIILTAALAVSCHPRLRLASCGCTEQVNVCVCMCVCVWRRSSRRVRLNGDCLWPGFRWGVPDAGRPHCAGQTSGRARPTHAQTHGGWYYTCTAHTSLSLASPLATVKATLTDSCRWVAGDSFVLHE